MDRRDAMSLPGSTSYFMQRGISDLSSEIRPISNYNLSFQFGANSIGSIPIEESSSSPSISHHNVNVSMQPSVPQASEPLKRKRGRPRKYGPDGAVSLALSSLVFTPCPKVIESVTQKRGRGRPPGSGKKQQIASVGAYLSGSTGAGFTPHVITIPIGEDIATKIMSFSQQGPRSVCVLSANGSVSTVTLHQHSTSGGTVTYEGNFEILCLSGSYLFTNNAVPHSRSGGLSVSLASPDGRVIGGGVGVLIAASPIQVILGSFLCGDSKTKENTSEEATNSNVRGVENVVNPTSLMSIWNGARPIDINLMRG